MEMSTPTLKVWLVDGGKVRDKLLEDFVLAGHDKVYNFVPNGEVWVEDSLSVKDMNAVLAHELHERKLMSGGMSYDNAHSSAEKVERRVRGMPAGKVDVKLKELVALNS
jgi:ABC-type taurine transport system substrate-binding protein